MNEQLLQFIFSIEDGRVFQKTITEEQLNQIQSHYPDFPKRMSLQALKRCIQNNIHPNKCKICGKDTTWIKGSNQNEERYAQYCSRQCQYSADAQKERVNKSHKTAIERYGNKNNTQKIQQTCLEKYGVKSVLELQQVQKAARSTCLEKYGADYFMQSDQGKQTHKNSMQQKYDVDYTFELEQVKQKSRETTRERYGSEYFMQTEQGKHCIRLSRRSTTWKYVLKYCEIKQLEPLFTFEDFMELNRHEFEYKCKRCGDIIKGDTNIHNVHCFKHYARSRGEDDIRSFLSNITQDELLQNKKFNIDGKRYELDIHVPAKNVGIEYNGLYYHSEMCVSPNYHIDKTNSFAKENIRLLHIFEHEWNTKQDIVKDILRRLFSECDNRIYARHCEVREVASEEANEFLLSNHIQGPTPAKVRMGLYHDEKLVQLITLGTPRYNKKYQWELIRFCSLLNTVCVGGVEKLFHHFLVQYDPITIISYCDSRLFEGKTYERLRFKFLNQTPPDYYYWKNGSMIIQHRSLYQKHKLHKLLDIFDPALTEHENMLNNGFYRVYDCGNKVFVWNRSN